MSRTKLSTKGQVVIPKEVRERASAKPGTEYDVATDGTVITLTPRITSGRMFPPLTIDELMARRIKWSGPPITDEDIRQAAMEGALARFERSLKS